MRPGPKPKSASQKELEGNPGNRPVPMEPELDVGAPEKPPFLTDAESEIWDGVTAPLERAGILRVVDLAVLLEYVVLFAEVVEISSRLKEEGLVIKDKKGSSKKNPLATLRNQAFHRLSRCRAELGLSPSARVGLGRASNKGQLSIFPPNADPEMFGPGGVN